LPATVPTGLAIGRPGARLSVAGTGDCIVREWEYRKLYLNQHSPRGDELEVLNAAGTAGWELVGITGHNVAYLKHAKYARAYCGEKG
jgi:hypothetical protein